MASDAICAKDPVAVLAHKIAVAGSAAAYTQDLGATLVVDTPNGVLPDGGLDERHALAALATVAFLPINGSQLSCDGGACGTQVWQASNDFSGASCGASAPAFCPTLQPLLELPAQPASCSPVGPPLALRVDASGANAGVVNFGQPNTEPATVNRMLASDRNSNCVAQVNLDDLSTQWLPANGPTTAVFASPSIPGSCLFGGDRFAAVLDAESGERQGPPPVGAMPPATA